MQKDRAQTRLEILKAVGRVLAENGFRGVGINAVAREAGVDKVLIYRYFGGLAELLKCFAEEGDFWPGTKELEEGAAGLESGDRAAHLIQSFSRALRKRPLTQEIMRWELLERNELTDALAEHRERAGAALFAGLEEETGGDARAVGSLLSAGLTYLALRAKTVDVYNGLNLNSDEDWARLEGAAGFLVRAALSAGRKETD